MYRNAHRASIVTMDPCLGAFPYDDGLRKFRSLSTRIDILRDLQRLNPRCGKICSVPGKSTDISADKEVASADEPDTAMGFVCNYFN